MIRTINPTTLLHYYRCNNQATTPLNSLKPVQRLIRTKRRREDYFPETTPTQHQVVNTILQLVKKDSKAKRIKIIWISTENNTKNDKEKKEKPIAQLKKQKIIQKNYKAMNILETHSPI